MQEAIQKRISIRNFSKENLSKEEIAKIQDWIDICNKHSHLNIEFLEDGSEAFKSLRKSYGMFSHVRSLLLMKGERKGYRFGRKSRLLWRRTNSKNDTIRIRNMRGRSHL